MARGGTHEFSSLKSAYAEFAGISLRTAQLHARTENPKWLEFLKANGYSGGVETSPAPVVVENSPEVSSPVIPSPEEHLEDRMLREHRELWEAAVDQARKATLRGDAVSATIFSKLASSHLAACERAKLTADKAAMCGGL